MSVDLKRHDFVKYQLKSKGSSLSTIANTLGVLSSSVTVVSQGYRRSSRVEAAIANALGTTPEELYPERYLQKEIDDKAST